MYGSGGPAPLAMIEAYSVCASVRPRRANTTVTRSPISLKIGERDERISTVAISLVIACTRRCRTEARIGSAASAISQPLDHVQAERVLREHLTAVVAYEVGVGHVGDGAFLHVDGVGMAGERHALLE